ncbi:MAG: lipoate--protein ligase family protein [Chloroflexota bacterium]
MAIDEAIVMAVGEGVAPPTVRFFAWQPPCLSLGYAQDAAEADVDRCRARGWDIVRRPTGGRAILHIDELTYSVVAPASDPRVAGGVLESYNRLSEALVAGLHHLGLMPERAKPIYQDRGALGAACFDGPAGYEITVGGRKLIGSAQMRRQGLVLQHGALPLEGDIARIAQALAFESEGERRALEARLRFRATTLHLALGRRVTPLRRPPMPWPPVSPRPSTSPSCLATSRPASANSPSGCGARNTAMKPGHSVQWP